MVKPIITKMMLFEKIDFLFIVVQQGKNYFLSALPLNRGCSIRTSNFVAHEKDRKCGMRGEILSPWMAIRSITYRKSRSSKWFTSIKFGLNIGFKLLISVKSIHLGFWINTAAQPSLNLLTAQTMIISSHLLISSFT